MPETEVRALVFFSLVLTILSLIFVNRSFSASLVTALRRPNVTLAWVLIVVAFLLALTLLWPVARELLRFGPLHSDDLLVTLSAGAFVLIVLETLKPILRPLSSRR
jgi:Ca2+-transporting ATPase